MKFIRNPLVILFAMVWTILSSAIAIVAHTLTLGFGDVSMWVGRHVWARPLLAVMGVTLTVEGRDRYEAGQPWVVAANHQGVLDIPVMFLAFPDLRIRFLAKKELFYIPVFGWYLWLAGHISVSRGNLRKAIKSIELAGERIKKHRSTIMVFPEGTRTEDGRIKGFKKGAFVLAAKTGVPVVPVAIVGSFGAINKNRWNIDPGSIHVRILDPIRTEGMTYEDRNALMRAVEASITAGVAVLRTEHDLPFEMAAMNQAQQEKAQEIRS